MHQNNFVRNSCLHGGWGGEENGGGNPFQRHQPFEVIISVENDK